MNLFVTSPDPTECAKWLDTKRLGWCGVKESAQLIATALAVKYGIETPIKPTHIHHPVSLWVRRCPENLYWTTNYMLNCGYEYKKRKNKEYHINGISAEKYWILFRQICRDNNFSPKKIKTIPRQFHNQAANKKFELDFTHIKDVHRAYRIYLAHRWTMDKIPPIWI